MTFMDCVNETLGTPELVANIDRLFGTSIATRRTPLELMVDRATGKQRADLGVLLWFVWEFVWTRIPDDGLDHSMDSFFAHLAAKYAPAEKDGA